MTLTTGHTTVSLLQWVVFHRYWFGADDAQRRTIVNNNFTTIQQWMETTVISYECSDPEGECQSDWYAYTYPGSTTIYICSYFWAWWPFSNEEEQAQTVVHELVHAAVGYLESGVYGQSACAALAVNNPAAAITNADNYGYFALDLQPGPLPQNNGIWTVNQSMSDRTVARPAIAASSSSGSLLLVYQGTKLLRVDISREASLSQNWTRRQVKDKRVLGPRFRDKSDVRQGLVGD
jgi:hypothetical protein